MLCPGANPVLRRGADGHALEEVREVPSRPKAEDPTPRKAPFGEDSSAVGWTPRFENTGAVDTPGEPKIGLTVRGRA